MSQTNPNLAAGTQGQERRANAAWTIMVYLAGDNTLSANSVAIMQELEAANDREDVHVLACFDSNTPRPKGSRYLEINRRRKTAHSGMVWGLHNDLVPPEERGEDHTVFAPDFCNPVPATVQPAKEPPAALGLDRFLEWGLREHLADRYMLILFGHGMAVAGKLFLTDDNPPSFLTLKVFRDLMAKHFGGKKLDILACDNCVMNGVETAFELKDTVELMLGSQGMMLTVGWPYRKIIDAVEEDPAATTSDVALKVLSACARNLLDFALMERSSEQAVCDLTKLNTEENLILALRNLSKKLQDCLYREGEPSVPSPPMCDAVRLARLEAQSYWDETFVDIYDFCELLLKRCDTFLKLQDEVLGALDLGDKTVEAQNQLLESETTKLFQDVAVLCREVLIEIETIVSHSYYICSELQYSHGLSVYFPWTLPEEPHSFKEVNETGDYVIRTAFDEYETYGFAGPGAADWHTFLRAFFKATLRNVRTADKSYLREKMFPDPTFFDFEVRPEERALPVNLLKSTLETGKAGYDCTCPKIKNYPRRHYLSPADCARKEVPGVSRSLVRGEETDAQGEPAPQDQVVSYLGWNVRGLVADIIKPNQPEPPARTADAGDSDPEPPAQ